MMWVSCWRSRCPFLSGPGVREAGGGSRQGGAVMGLGATLPMRWASTSATKWIGRSSRPCRCEKQYSHCFLLPSKSHAKMSVVDYPNWKHTWKRILGNVVHSKLVHYKTTRAIFQQFHSSIYTQKKCIHMFTKTCTRIYTITYSSPPLSTEVTF